MQNLFLLCWYVSSTFKDDLKQMKVPDDMKGSIVRC